MTPQSQLILDPDLGYEPAKKKSRSTYDRHDSTDWSLDRLTQVQSEFQKEFGRQLPLVNKGQGSIHNRWGYDHRNSADVSINPASDEGKRFSEFLRQRNVPYLAFDRPVPGVSTGRHYHLGQPSRKTPQRFTVGAQQKAKGVIVDPDLGYEVGTSDVVIDPDLGFEEPQGRFAAMARADRSQPMRRRPGRVEASGLGGTPQSQAKELVRSMAMDKPPLDPLREQVREQAKRDWSGQGPPNVGTSILEYPRRALETIADPVGAIRRVKDRFTGDEFEAEVERRYQDQLRQQSPEVIRGRQAIGRIPGSVPGRPTTASPRGLVTALTRFGGGLVKTAGGVANLGGLASAVGLEPELAKYLNERGQYLEDIAALPLNEQGQAIERGLPEKATEAVTSLGLTVAQIALLKRATGLRLSTIMATEAALKSSNKPAAERAAEIATAYGMGKVLDTHLSRPASAALFGAPTAVQTGLAVQRGDMSLEDALLQTGIETGAGAILAGGKRGKIASEQLREGANEPERLSTTKGISSTEGTAPQGRPNDTTREVARPTESLVPEPQPAITARQSTSENIAPRAGVTRETETQPMFQGRPVLLDVERLPNETKVQTQPNVETQLEGAKPQWQHRDFGLVTESANQSGTGRGRVRVVTEDGAEHIIQRPKGTGAGNQIAIPVREQGGTPGKPDILPAEPKSIREPSSASATKPQSEAASQAETASLPSVESEASATSPAPESVLRNAVKSTGSESHPFAAITKPEWVNKILTEAGAGAKQLKLAELMDLGLTKDDPFGGALYFRTTRGDIVKIGRASVSDKPPTVGTRADGLVIERLTDPATPAAPIEPKAPEAKLERMREIMREEGVSEGDIRDLIPPQTEGLQPRESTVEPGVAIEEKISVTQSPARRAQNADTLRSEGGSLEGYDAQSQAEWLGRGTRFVTPIPRSGRLKVYRATPEGHDIADGDYVTTNRKYAEYHIESNLGGKGKITEREVGLDELYPADAPSEFWFAQKKGQEDARRRSEVNTAPQLRGSEMAQQPQERNRGVRDVAERSGGRPIRIGGERESDQRRAKAPPVGIAKTLPVELPPPQGKEPQEINIPESPQTLQAQIGERGFTFVPNENLAQARQLEGRPLKRAEGMIYYDPQRISDVAYLRNTPLPELLGHVEPKSLAATEAVVARKPDGTEIQTSVVSPENLPAQIAETKSRLPNAEVRVESPEKVVAERLARPEKLFEESGLTLAQAVRRAGGMRYDKDLVNRGELKPFTLREGRNFINNKSGRTLEQMAEDMAVEGYGIGDWAHRDSVKGMEVDRWRFLEALEEDASGRRPHYSDKYQPDPFKSPEYKAWIGEEQGRANSDAFVTLLENERSGVIYDKIRAGRANESEVRQFRELAAEQGASPEFAEEIISSAREAGTPRSAGATEESRPSSGGQRQEPVNAATPELQRFADQATAVRQKLSSELTNVERSAIERKVARLEARARGEELRRSGADPYELIDDLIIRGGELIREGKKSFNEWSRKMREEFGKDADPHLQRTWNSLHDESQLPKAASVKNAATAELRADLGLLEMERPERKTWEQTIDNALAKGLDKKAESIADDVIKGKTEGLTDEQSAGIQHRMRELENQWEEIYRADPADSKLIDIEKRLDNLSKATDMGGTAPARALSFRRSAQDKEFKLINLIQQAKKAYGRELTPKERGRYEEIVKERDRAVKERDEALEKLHTKRLQNELDKAARVKAREGSKKALDEEAAVIKQNITAEFARLKSQRQSGAGVQPSILAGIDPEGVITKNLLRYARNRAKANIGLKAEALIDEVHSLVSDFGVTRRQVAEVLSGYGRQPVDRRSEAAKHLAAIRSEITSLLKAEDVAAGIRTEKRQGPENVIKRNQRRLDQLLKQEKEWERKLTERDFESRRKPEPYPYNSDVRRAEDRVRIAEAKFKREMERARPGHQIRNLSGIMKSWLLSGPPTQGMNIIGTGSYQVFREVARAPAAIADAIWSAGRQATGYGAQRSITGPSPSAMLDSVIQSGKVGGREFLEIMKHGATKEQMERHQYQEIDFGVNTGKAGIDSGVKAIELAHNAVFRFMSGSDRVFFQGAYKRNLIDRARVQALNEGVSDVKARTKELVDNPTERMDADAKHDALVSTFNNNNWLSTKIKRARAAVINPESLMTEKSAQRLNAVENLAMDFVLPFDRTPTNVVTRIVEASPLGYGKNVGQLVAAMMRGSMPREHQRQMMQTFGNATTGTALLALGWYLGDKAKGIIVVDGNDVYLKIPGLPKINLRTASPAGNILATGARLRVVHQTEDSTWGDYAKPALREAGNIPVLRAGSPVLETIRDPERSGPKTAARFASMAVPFSGAARWAGQVIDPADKRYPDTSFKEQFQKGIPKWRESLPASRARLLGSKQTKAVTEVERLGMDIQGVVRQQDEPLAEFKKRKEIVNPYIRRALEKMVAAPDYDKASDEEKLERLKQTKEAGQAEGQAAYDAIPRPQKFVKPKKVYPAPSGKASLHPWLPPRNPFKPGSEAFRA